MIEKPTYEELEKRVQELERIEFNYKQTEERHRFFSDNAIDAFYLSDMKGRILDVNKAACVTLGYTHEEMLAMTISDVDINFPSDKLSEILESLHHNEPRLVETSHTKKNGEIFPVDVWIRSFGPKEQPLLVSFARDITDRKQAEEVLRESEERFSAMFEHMSSGVAIYKPIYDGKDFIFTAFNNAAEKITNISRDDAIGNRLLDLFPNMDESGLLGSLQKVYKTGVPEIIPPFYYEDKTRKGWRKNRIYALPTGELVALFDDVTDRFEIEIKLKESEKKYRSMMESTKNGSYICSPEFRILYMNPAMIDRVGTDATGEICHKAIYDRDEQCSWCVFDQIQKGEHIDYEMIDPKDNHYYSVTNSLIFYADGTASKLSIFHDITQIKNIETQLQQSQKMESIGTLAGGIAHDFNNILFPIVGHADILLMDTPEDSPSRDGLNEIYTSALRAKDLVRQILTFSRQESGKLMLMKMQPIIKEALKLIRSTIPTTIDIIQDIRSDCGVIKADPNTNSSNCNEPFNQCLSCHGKNRRKTESRPQRS